jgi:hypothetical protein
VAAAAARAHSDTPARSAADASPGPARPSPAATEPAQTRAVDRAARDPAGDHAEVGPSQPWGCPAVPTCSTNPAVRTGRTRTRDARTRTPAHRTPGTGRADTGHRDRTRTGDDGRASRTSSTATTTKSARRTPSPPPVGGACGLATNDGSEMGHRQRDRDNRSDQAAARVRSTVQGARLGALLSSDDFGSSVERDEGGHPLWRVHS